MEKIKGKRNTPGVELILGKWATMGPRDPASLDLAHRPIGEFVLVHLPIPELRIRINGPLMTVAN